MDYNDKEIKGLLVDTMRLFKDSPDDEAAVEMIKAFNGALANRQTKIFEQIKDVILTVENRCMTHDTVTPTLKEMSEEELRKIWLLALNGSNIQ